MSNLKGVFSHNSDDWATPKDIYSHFIDKIGCIDPCPLNSSVDNLNCIYAFQYLFVNPPYSKIKLWIDFVKNNVVNGAIVYLLIPARTDTKYFFELIYLPNCAKKVYFIKGRLKFGDSNSSAPFPSVLIKIYKHNYEFIDTIYITREEILQIF